MRFQERGIEIRRLGRVRGLYYLDCSLVPKPRSQADAPDEEAYFCSADEDWRELQPPTAPSQAELLHGMSCNEEVTDGIRPLLKLSREAVVRSQRLNYALIHSLKRDPLLTERLKRTLPGEPKSVGDFRL
jgi:hypothetical protein